MLRGNFHYKKESTSMHAAKRPVNLDLRTIRQPITAIVSILHRISGIGVFILLPFVLYYLRLSLSSSLGFDAIQHYFFCKLVLFLFLTGLIYHSIAGIRHLLMDIGIGETLEGGRTGAKIVLILSILAVIWLGVTLWV